MTDLGSEMATARAAAEKLIVTCDPVASPPVEFLGAAFDAGLTWVHFPVGSGGLGLARGAQRAVDEVLEAAGAPLIAELNPIGHGMVAPTLQEHARPDVAPGLLRPLATGEDIWCQLFSEPSAGSDLAGLATRATWTGSDWRVTGQKVWTSLAHRARWGLLLARTDPNVPKHRGLTAFVVDMTAPGVEVRPLRQMTGEAEFNEVLLAEVRIPDHHRVGEVGSGWSVARTTLMNERTSIGGSALDGDSIAEAIHLWRVNSDRRTPVLRDRLAGLWVTAAAHRATIQRIGQAAETARSPGPEGTIAKLEGAELNQGIYEFCIELLGPAGTLLPSPADDGPNRSPQWTFLRSRANTIEGGTSDVLRNIIAERLLGLPAEPRTDTNRPWSEVPRG